MEITISLFFLAKTTCSYVAGRRLEAYSCEEDQEKREVRGLTTTKELLRGVSTGTAGASSISAASVARRELACFYQRRLLAKSGSLVMDLLVIFEGMSIEGMRV